MADATSIQGKAIATTAPGRGEVQVFNFDADEYRLGKPAPPGHYNVEDYGIVANDTNVILELQALIDTATSGNAGVTIYLPPGIYYCEDDLHITRTVVMQGAGPSLSLGGSVPNATTIRFAEGKGLIVHGPYYGPLTSEVPREGGYATDSIFRDLYLKGATLPTTTLGTRSNTAGVSYPKERRQSILFPLHQGGNDGHQRARLPPRLPTVSRHDASGGRNGHHDGRAFMTRTSPRPCFSKPRRLPECASG